MLALNPLLRISGRPGPPAFGRMVAGAESHWREGKEKARVERAQCNESKAKPPSARQSISAGRFAARD